MSKTLYYNSNTHQLVIGDCASNELIPITVEPTLSTLDNKQDKTSNELKTVSKEIPKSINEVLYNIWNPVLYETLIKQGDSNPNMSPCGIVLNPNGSLSLTWKNVDNETPFNYTVKQTDGNTAYFVTKEYIPTALSENKCSKLDTFDKTIIGAINELASYHELSDSYFTTYADPTAFINFSKLDLVVESSSQMYKLTGVVKSSIDNGQTNACLAVVPKDQAYNNPINWKDVEYEQYYDDIIIVEFDETFELPEGKSINDYILYICFAPPSVINDLIPSGLGDPNAWELGTHALFTTYPVTIMVSNPQLLPVEPITAEYLTPEIQDQVNALSEKITQLENELNLANNATVELTNTIASQSEQIAQLQTDLSQATTRISTLEADTAWLKDLNQEEMLQYWGSKTSTEE